jgi:nucleoside-diphosphate-sugar epimerase
MKNLSYGLELFKLLAESGCRRIVVSGSCWEYGVEHGKIVESQRLEPTNPFAAAKVALHTMGEAIAKARSIDFVWLRFFYVYGPLQRRESLIPYLIERATHNLLPDVKNQKGGNDFIYVDDVARAVVAALGRGRGGGTYNVGSGKVTGVAEIANLIYGRRVMRAVKPQGFYADITRAKDELDWKPATHIKKGIRNTLAFYRRHL